MATTRSISRIATAVVLTLGLSGAAVSTADASTATASSAASKVRLVTPKTRKPRIDFNRRPTASERRKIKRAIRKWNARRPSMQRSWFDEGGCGYACSVGGSYYSDSTQFTYQMGYSCGWTIVWYIGYGWGWYYSCY